MFTKLLITANSLKIWPQQFAQIPLKEHCLA